MIGAQMDISEILGSIQSDEPLLSTHRRKIETLMRHFQAAGLTLDEAADSRHLARSIETLKSYAREFRLRFPDYCPQSLMSAEELKASRKRKHRVAP